jgi:thermostable 8-oxoguanine DNA glycosylase
MTAPSNRVGSIDVYRGELREVTVPRRAGAPATTRHYWTGLPWQLGSAAYWEALARTSNPAGTYQLGQTLAEEIGACVLGGYGIPAQLALAAFRRLRDAGVFRDDDCSTRAQVEELLSEPFHEFDAPRRYRFPRQKATRLHAALDALRVSTPPELPLELREWLMRLPGVGPKTASWIVRNHTGSGEVAIIDIHIIRAGTAAGVFDARWSVSRDYETFERAFVSWASQAGISAAALDATVWGVLANAGAAARDILGTTQLSALPDAVWPIDPHVST